MGALGIFCESRYPGPLAMVQMINFLALSAEMLVVVKKNDLQGDLKRIREGNGGR